MIKKILHKILGIDKVITQLNGRLTLIENVVGINNFMSIGEGNIGDGNVGIGSTVPEDIARFQAHVQNQNSGNVGAGNVGDGNVGIGSTAPADGNVGDGNVGDGNVGDGGSTETQPLTPVPAPEPASNVGDGNVGDGNIGVGNI